ncbi:MAG: GerMN domain-containing protein [Bacilli bacterium]
MLKRMILKKITITALTLFILLLIYLMPTNKINNRNLDVKQNLEYTYTNDLETIYLLDYNDYVARTFIKGCSCSSAVDKASDLLQGLIVEGKKSNIIPNGFKAIIPSGTRVLALNLDKGVLTINFSKEILEINKKYEEKMLESLIYTLTSINGIDSVKILVEGEELKQLPNSNKQLPSLLDRDYGINKVYNLTGTNNIDSYTVFYVNEFNDNYYYVPVTKYINNDKLDKIKIIIEELTSNPVYESNLMSFLNVNTKLLDYEIKDDVIKLNFNNLILSDITGNSILEEVIYTISLSVSNEIDVKEVIFMVENEEIYKKVLE